MNRSWVRWGALSPDDRALVRARALELAKKPEAAREGDQLEVIELLSAGLRCVLPLSAVDGVTEVGALAPLPVTTPGLRGLLSFRGEVMPAFDLGALLNARGGAADLKRVVALSAGGLRATLLVEQVVTVGDVMRDDFREGAFGAHGAIVGVDATMRLLLAAEPLLRLAFATVQSDVPR